MKIKDQPVILKGTAGNVRIQRMTCGFPRIESDDPIDLHYGLGYLHGHDRQMQMWLMKIIGRGRDEKKKEEDFRTRILRDPYSSRLFRRF